MKKIIMVFIFLSLIVSIYVLTNNTNSKTTTFSFNNKVNKITRKFDSKYNLSTSISNENDSIKKEIIELSKKTTNLLLGDIDSKNETSKHYYNRHKEYLNLAAFKYFPKDKESSSGYDESIDDYKYASISQYFVPAMFNTFNELEIIYNTYGDIRVTINGNMAISMVLLPNVSIKKVNENNPLEYITKKENLVIYYYFLKINNDYKLCYLYGEYGENIQKYFDELASKEKESIKAVSYFYQFDFKKIYNYDKLNMITDDKIKQIYDQNINNLVYLSSYYNTGVVNNANGFIINDGIVVTTWDFFEKSLLYSQNISISDSKLNNYEIDGIITINPSMNIVLIKLKTKTGNIPVIGNSSLLKANDPVFTISSKFGISYLTQKGIIISNDDYLQTSIPLIVNDEGSPLFNANGEIVGINTSKSINTNTSIAINSVILNEIQEKFNKIDFDSIQTISFENLKQDYYLKYNNEKIIKQVPTNKLKKYLKIGNIEKNISLELVKISYDNKTVSFRYKNKIPNFIDTMQFAFTYKKQLIEDGFKEQLASNSKCIYKNKDYQVIITTEFDYLLIVMVKL